MDILNDNYKDYKAETPFDFKLVKIPKKKKGEFREICVPSDSLKRYLRIINFELNKISLSFDKEVIGFTPGRNCASGAKFHVGYNFSLNFDLKDFFDTVTLAQIPEQFQELCANCFIGGRAYQGLPTSPAVANLAFLKTDKLILGWIENYVKSVLFYGENEKVVYTRYADDLTFSFNHYETYHQLRRIVPQIVESQGFTINSRKTHLQSAKFGRRMITGIGVDRDNIYIPREIKRKIRSAKHKQKYRALSGLLEWSKLKMPNSSPLAKNSLVFNTLAEVNRVNNVINKANTPTINTIFGAVTQKLDTKSTNYNFIGPIQECQDIDLNKKLKSRAKQKRHKAKNLSIDQVKRNLKIRSKLAFKEVFEKQKFTYDVVREDVENKLKDLNIKIYNKKNSAENSLTKSPESAILAEDKNLAEELLS